MLTLIQVLERIDLSLPTIIPGSKGYTLEDILNKPVLNYQTTYCEAESTYKNYITVLF